MRERVEILLSQLDPTVLSGESEHAASVVGEKIRPKDDTEQSSQHSQGNSQVSQLEEAQRLQVLRLEERLNHEIRRCSVVYWAI